MNKKVKKRFNFKRFFIFLLFLVFFITVIVFISKIRVKTFLVKGNYRVSEEEILSNSYLLDYPSFIGFNTFKARKNIKKNILIKDVHFDRKKDFTIVVNVIEHKLLFNIRSSNETITSEGKRLNINLEDVPTLINFVSDEMLSKMIDKFSYLNDDVLSKISEIEYTPNMYDNERFVFYMRDSNMVYITLSKIKEFNNYNKIKDQIGTNSGILYLDSGNYFEIK